VLKKSENPPILSPVIGSLAEAAAPWWVAHTRARFEKAFAWDLLRRRIAYFLPMIERVTVSGGRKRRGMAPLFSSYVFFSGGDRERQAALATNRLCQTIQVADQARLVGELTMIEKALRCQAPLDPYPFAVAGRRCRIAGGPFMGLEGTVVDRTKMARLVLEVSILGRGAVLEIDADLLEPID
jgi:hypothetical protein